MGTGEGPVSNNSGRIGEIAPSRSRGAFQQDDMSAVGEIEAKTGVLGEDSTAPQRIDQTINEQQEPITQTGESTNIPANNVLASSSQHSNENVMVEPTQEDTTNNQDTTEIAGYPQIPTEPPTENINTANQNKTVTKEEITESQQPQDPVAPKRMTRAMERMFGDGVYRFRAVSKKEEKDKQEEAQIAASVNEKYDIFARDIFEFVLNYIPENQREQTTEKFNTLLNNLVVGCDVNGVVVDPRSSAHYEHDNNRIVFGQQAAQELWADNVPPNQSFSNNKAILLHETAHMIQKALGLFDKEGHNPHLNEIGAELLARVAVDTESEQQSYNLAILGFIDQTMKRTLLPPKESLELIWRAAWGDDNAIKMMPHSLYTMGKNYDLGDIMRYFDTIWTLPRNFSEEQSKELKQELHNIAAKWADRKKTKKSFDNIVAGLAGNHGLDEFWKAGEELAGFEKDIRRGSKIADLKDAAAIPWHERGFSATELLDMLKESLDLGFTKDAELQKMLQQNTSKIIAQEDMEALIPQEAITPFNKRQLQAGMMTRPVKGTIISHIGKELNQHLEMNTVNATLQETANKKLFDSLIEATSDLLTARYDYATERPKYFARQYVPANEQEDWVANQNTETSSQQNRGFGKKMPTKELQKIHQNIVKTRKMLLSNIKEQHGSDIANKYAIALKSLTNPDKLFGDTGLKDEVESLYKGR